MSAVRLHLLSPAGAVPPSETLRRQRDQPFAVQVEVYQGKGCQQPLMILQTPIAHPGKSKHPLQETGEVYVASTADVLSAIVVRDQNQTGTPSRGQVKAYFDRRAAGL